MPTVQTRFPAPLALTMGDPAGIGPDIALQAWCMRADAGLSSFVVMGDPETFKCRARDLRLNVPVALVDSAQAARDCYPESLPVYPVRLTRPARAGAPDTASSAAVIEAIDTAVAWVRQGKAAAIVTNPINKNLLAQAGFAHPGHTEYLAELCSETGQPLRPVMLLTSGELRVVPVTVHIPLKDVPSALTARLIVETVEITARDLQKLFGVFAPRIAVTGLNPHAGEGGTLGREEIDVIAPAIETLRNEGFQVAGPLPADAAFQERSRSMYDVMIAMYHDQALIPVKTLAFDRTVNVTLGLPIVRTSPDHGTAYDLAGTGRADPGSRIESLRLAERLTARQEATAK
jgi:4-hydroxythreonine-4-phosphate dehydrogenase